MHFLKFATSRIIFKILNKLELVHMYQLCQKLSKIFRTIFLRVIIMEKLYSAYF